MAVASVNLSPMNVDPKAQNKFITFVIVLVAYFILRSEWRKFQKDRTYATLQSDPNAQLAVRIHAAFNVWGIDWLGGIDGTDTKEVYAIAAQIRDFNAVATAYQNLYNVNLIDDLRKELSPSEYQQFMATLGASTGVGTVPTSQPIPGKSKVYCLLPGPVRDPNAATKTLKDVNPGDEIGTYYGAVNLTYKNSGTFPAVLVKWKDWLFIERTGVIEKRLVQIR